MFSTPVYYAQDESSSRRLTAKANMRQWASRQFIVMPVKYLFNFKNDSIVGLRSQKQN
jgi:hypothetical protein